uniref:Uncharacterized protein n=1 Tax=Arundo donax TaxID=35708 RepID=A0A0A8ZIA5_ARUDO
MREAGGDGGGFLRPGADGADVGVEVGEDGVGAARQADGAGVVRRRRRHARFGPRRA